VTLRIAPSILAADFARLGEEVAQVEAAGADLLHVDVMDGHFVPNITFGIPIVAALKRITRLPLDVHLMITEPDRHLDEFVRAGASRIAIHVEAEPHLHHTLARIREMGARAGVAVNPSTPLAMIESVVPLLDHLLIMSVDPGFAGQSFIPSSFEKLRDAQRLLRAHRSPAELMVDGGVRLDNAARVAQSGATVLVAASAVFGPADRQQAVRALRAAAQAR
jgi:ribulose-phosphate 3-epimerase